MDQILLFIKEQIKRPKTLPLVGSGSVLIIFALIMGIADNLPGIIVVFVGLIMIVFAGAHHWREARIFGTLFAVSLISFPVLVLLHNIFDGINQKYLILNWISFHYLHLLLISHFSHPFFLQI